MQGRTSGSAGSAARVAGRLAAALGALAATGLLLARTAPHDWPHDLADVPRWLAAPPPEARVLALATVAAYGCLAWLAVVLVATAAGSRTRFAPYGLRRAAERVLGLAVATAAAGVLAAGPALADAPRPGHGGAGPFDRPVAAAVVAAPPRGPAAADPSHGTTAPPAAVRGTAPGAAPGAAPAPRPATKPAPLLGVPRAVPDDSVVVRHGDTLWDIAARHLGPGATPARVAAAWPRWYAANRAVIGADPDRILPGQRLVPPLPTGGTR
jgi:nucleoid-associated protein YgaU